MQLTKFRVCNFRNVRDSGWIEVGRLTAFVGQNEAGKSNLCEALYLLNPYDEKNYNVDEDWPADDWGNKDRQALVCQAVFRLSDPHEIKTLLAAVDSSGSSLAAAAHSTPFSPEPSGGLDLVVSRYYDQHREFEITDVGTLDQKAAEIWAEAHLQKCVYIKDYDLPGSRAELPDLAKRRQLPGTRLSADEELMLIVLDLAKVDVDDIVRKADTPDGRTLRSFDKRLASAYLSAQFAKLWKSQREVRFEIEIDGPTLNIFVEDVGLGMPIRLHRRSTGFRWYVAFAWKFTHATKGAYKNCILLLEEPGIHLHYSAHNALLGTLDELANTNTIIYTTHVATMLDPAFPERVRIVEVEQQHTRVIHGIVSSQRMPMMVIEACLGLSREMSELLGNRQTLIVEGGADALILHKLSAVFTNSGLPGLSETIYLWPAEGAAKTPMFAGLLVGQNFDGGVLLDSDEEGNAAREKISNLYLKDLSAARKFRVFMLAQAAGLPNDEASIEDMFPEFYLECVMRAYRVVIMPDDLAKESSPQITKRVENALKTRHGRHGLDRSLVMHEMMRVFERWRKVEDLPKGVAERAASLFAAINKEFR